MWWRRQFDRFPGSTPWSKFRRLFSYYITLAILLLITDFLWLQTIGSSAIDTIWTAALILTFSFVYFATVVVGVIFLSSAKFRPNPTRLAWDTLRSIAFCILSFAALYRFTGISLDTACPFTADALDHIYFSAVTFSTLGYGDFRPCEAGRLIAAAQAIYGNLHLGLIVGCAFFFAQVMATAPATSQDEGGDKRNVPNDKEH